MDGDTQETVTQLSETTKQIVRSRTCGCKDFYVAAVTQNDAKGYLHNKSNPHLQYSLFANLFREGKPEPVPI